MKRLLTALSLSASVALCAAAQTQTPNQPPHGRDAAGHGQHKEGHGKAAPPEQTADVNLAEGQVVRRGEPIGGSPVVKLADVLSEPQKYAGRKVIVEGVVERVCQKRACWMEIAPEKGARGVRVEFGEHAFFVPFNSAGLKARAEGTFAVKHLTSEEADHLEKDGAKNLRRDKDGAAADVNFVATGLELRK